MSYEQTQLLKSAYMSINDAINYLIKSNVLEPELGLDACLQLAGVQKLLSEVTERE